MKSSQLLELIDAAAAAAAYIASPVRSNRDDDEVPLGYVAQKQT